MAFSPETYALLKGQGGGGGEQLPTPVEANVGSLVNVYKDLTNTPKYGFLTPDSDDGSFVRSYDGVIGNYGVGDFVYLFETTAGESGFSTEETKINLYNKWDAGYVIATEVAGVTTVLHPAMIGLAKICFESPIFPLDSLGLTGSVGYLFYDAQSEGNGYDIYLYYWSATLLGTE